MKEIRITTQEQLDQLKEIEKDESVVIETELKLNATIAIFGRLLIKAKIECSWAGRYFVAWGNASVVAWGNASVEAWGNALARLFSANANIILYGFSVLFVGLKLKAKVVIKSKHAHIQTYKPLGWFENNAVEKKSKIILYKRVSSDFKTQEGNPNETLWPIGATVDHKAWDPSHSECGEGKFHACSRPYFCDEFRSTKGDRYIAIEVALKDVYEWKNNPDYPHKIGFRKGLVLYECNRLGKEIKKSE